MATLASAGRAPDLLPHGIRAMEHATRLYSQGLDAIPDRDGEFFIAALTGALKLYQPYVPKDRWLVWRQRMQTPSSRVIAGGTNNWQTYLMKGEWMRAQAGLVPAAEATATIEQAWNSEQRQRFAAEPWDLYHDRTSDPDSLNVEAVGRGNLLALIQLGYNGPSAAEIRRLVEAGTRTTLLLQDPTGQAPTNGRTDDHVWVDIGYQLAFEVMAERMRQQDPWLAGQYRHAAILAFESAGRWRRTEPGWAGSFFVTKNHFDPSLRVGYQNASQYSNYNGSFMFHLSEAYQARASEIEEHPSPAEIGGYALATDKEFASVFANAGGMQMQANLRGDTQEASGNYWTPTGVVRFSRAGWESRLGPSDGALTAEGGVTFAPTFQQSGRWVRLADLGVGYVGEWSVQFTHPALVRCSIIYHPDSTHSGPVFENTFVITPDGILSEVRKTSPEALPWGVTWPLLENDGRPLVVTQRPAIATTAYEGAGDEENFIALNDRASLDFSGHPLRSTYGDLRPVTVTAPDDVNRTFIYPRKAGEPNGEDVRHSFRLTTSGFRSVLGRVEGNVYIGRTVAGGEASSVDLDGDGKPDVTFSAPCGFLLQLSQGKVVAAEVDREVQATIQGLPVRLLPFTPVYF